MKFSVKEDLFTFTKEIPYILSFLDNALPIHSYRGILPNQFYVIALLFLYPMKILKTSVFENVSQKPLPS